MSENPDQFEDREDGELEPLEQAHQSEENGEDEGERELAQEHGDPKAAAARDQGLR